MIQGNQNPFPDFNRLAEDYLVKVIQEDSENWIIKDQVIHFSPKFKQERQDLKKKLFQVINYLFLNSSLTENDEINRTEASSICKNIFYLKNSQQKLERYEMYVTCSEFDLHCLLKKDNQKVSLNFFEQIVVITRILHTIFHGNRLEVIHLSTVKEAPTAQLPDSYWEEPSKHISDYESIHLVLSEMALKIANKIPTPFLLEICGGRGGLAGKILKQMAQKCEYVLLESNPTCVQNARKTLAQKVRVIEQNVVFEDFFLDEEKKQLFQPESVDLVIGSGALNVQVLKDRDQALKVLGKIDFVLKEGGFLLLSGLTPSLLSSEDFQKYRFEVVNTSYPLRIYPLYVLRKTKRSHEAKGFL